MNIFVTTLFNLRFTIFAYNESFYFNNLASSITVIGALPIFLIDRIKDMTI